MPVRIVCRKNEFHDSMVLMRINESIRQIGGIVRVAVLMATENNKKILADYGFWNESIQAASVTDLILAVDAINDEKIEEAFTTIDKMFAERVASRKGKKIFKTQNAALGALPEANLALISVPGAFAAMEARKALKNSLNVFLFSDNVSLENELSLKKLAFERDLIVMGPDCGTAIINGVALGFANRVRRGEIGIVASSGTGIQEVCTQVHRSGMGISHAIGTGGRDLSKEIGGISMRQGIDFLIKDSQTRLIILISKPPDSQVQNNILNYIRDQEKRFVINFLGTKPREIGVNNCYFVETLDEAADTAIVLMNGRSESSKKSIQGRLVQSEIAKLNSRQKYLRGLFSGGTLAYEAISILSKTMGPINSNIPLNPQWGLVDSRESRGHTVVDMGEDEFTQGRAHPMIDPSLLMERFKKEASDPEVACILLDCMLGLSAHPDPAGILSPIIRECKEEAKKTGRHLSVVLSICGTEEDPQVYSTQEKKFIEAGAIILPSNAKAVEFAGLVCKDRG